MTAPDPRARTAAASQWHRRRRTERLALQVSARMRLLDDEWLRRVTAVLAGECRRRGLVVPDLDADE